MVRPLEDTGNWEMCDIGRGFIAVFTITSQMKLHSAILSMVTPEKKQRKLGVVSAKSKESYSEHYVSGYPTTTTFRNFRKNDLIELFCDDITEWM